MKLKYEVPIKEGSSVSLSTGSTSTKIDRDIKLSFQTDSDKVLTRIVVEISNRNIKYDPKDYILTEYPELDDQLFRVITYISNSIYIQTTIDALDPHNSQHYSPELIPESPQEEEELATKKKGIKGSLKIINNIEGNFSIKELTLKRPHTEPVAHYANALRTVSLLQKYEQFYKVIECFYGYKGGSDFVEAVSKHALQHDKTYDKARIEAFKKLRVQLVHPKPWGKLAHLSPEDLEAFRNVKAYLKSIQKLAKLLLDNPP